MHDGTADSVGSLVIVLSQLFVLLAGVSMKLPSDLDEFWLNLFYTTVDLGKPKEESV